MTVEQLTERLNKAQKRLARLEAQERPLAFRGWRDDFLGDQIQDEYFQETSGAGSAIALVDGLHGGAVNLLSGPASTRYARLWLGDNADGFDTLDADEGYIQIVRMRINDVSAGNFDTSIRTSNAAGTRAILTGLNIWLDATNWVIQCTDAAGNSSTVTDAAFDTNWHWHRIEVYPTSTGHEVDYFLDGALIGQHTTNVPTDILTAFLLVYSGGAVARNADFDYWGVIPRNIT